MSDEKSKSKKKPVGRAPSDRRMEEKRRATMYRVPTIWLTKELGNILDVIVADNDSTKKEVLSVGLELVNQVLNGKEKLKLADIKEAISNGEHVIMRSK